MNIAVLHPDLGLGGAERLIVDAAVALQSKGNNVHVFTSHHEKDRAFEETVNGTLDVQVYGDWFPRTIFHRFHILCAIVRMFIVTICVWLFHRQENFDVFLVDQVSAHIPLIRILFPRAKIVFYLHFPDKLLVQGRESSILKRIYRVPFDLIEEWTTGKSDRILVNSRFTLNVYKASFPRLAAKQERNGTLPEVLYPCINTDTYDIKPDESELDRELEEKFANHKVIVSVNRFERKKAIDLLVKAFAILAENPSNQKHNLLMVLAGGYDKRVTENVEYLAYLKQLVEQSHLQDKALYLTSFTNAQRYTLLHKSFVLAYTPENEHFGIVPVEAMFCERCVVAVNSGGPLESIVHGQTGLLADPNPQAFADAIQKFLDMDESEARAYGKKGRQRVEEIFSLRAMAERLHRICCFKE
jgi:alpha-1,3/alpha-1,6-mannosyltransferase